MLIFFIPQKKTYVPFAKIYPKYCISSVNALLQI